MNFWTIEPLITIQFIYHRIFLIIYHFFLLFIFQILELLYFHFPNNNSETMYTSLDNFIHSFQSFH